MILTKLKVCFAELGKFSLKEAFSNGLGWEAVVGAEKPVERDFLFGMIVVVDILLRNDLALLLRNDLALFNCIHSWDVETPFTCIFFVGYKKEKLP